MREDKQICTFGPDSEYVDLAAEVFRLLSDPTRIRIILALRDQGELSVNRLSELIGKSATATSQHLAKLRWGRIVGVRQEGTRMHYRLIDTQARELVALAVFQAEHALGDSSVHERAGVPDEAGKPTGGCPAKPSPEDS